jgi:hypothetical protein
MVDSKGRNLPLCEGDRNDKGYLHRDQYGLVDPDFTRWYDWLWLLIPIAGIIGLIVAVEGRRADYVGGRYAS